MSDSNMSDGYGDCKDCQYYEKREHSYIEQIKSLQSELDQRERAWKCIQRLAIEAETDEITLMESIEENAAPLPEDTGVISE